jgi:hypothetical protein
MKKSPTKAAARTRASARTGAATPRPVRPTLTTAEFKRLLDAKRIVGDAVRKLAPNHAQSEAFISAWSHISLWLEDNA